ncbi:MAG TPA: lysophospholipid acyltransferase family protein, partial [Myxococcota bacterium]|nr:lysophospholipid acyltransferase family protein [Myxococcota bacterium]
MAPEAASIKVPPTLVRRGRKLLGWAQRQFYDRVMDVDIAGAEHIPADTGFLVAANHASHLDAGLVKAGLGALGDRMLALAAQDYFFKSPLRRWYFENFTNLMPLERSGSFKSTMRRCLKALSAGTPLLIFPEGTRSRDGRIATFKPAIGYLAMASRAPVLPMYLWGTYEAMPKGGLLIPMARRIGVVIGPAIPAELLDALTAGKDKHEAYRVASGCVEMAVRALRERHPLSPERLYEAMRAQEGEVDEAAQVRR